MEDNNFIPWDYPIDAHTYIRNLLIDGDEDDDVRIHTAALCGDVRALTAILAEEVTKKWINFRVRPFLAPPLRLAATGGSFDCIRILIEAGASVDLEDIKGQTPLFVATSLKNLEAMEILLKYGACPEGSRKNRGTPLIIAVRDGFVEGLKLLLKYGASSEPFDQLTSCVPCWPLQHAVVYNSFSCFLVLLQTGALPNINRTFDFINKTIHGRLSIPHAILKYAKNSPEFVWLYHESGGELRQPDHTGAAVTSFVCVEKSPAYEILMSRIGNPMTLRWLCRLRIRNLLGRNRLEDIRSLDIPSTLHSFLCFEEYDKYSLSALVNDHTKLVLVEQ